MDRVKELDLYQLLGIPVDETDIGIRKAYRKKALQCHPDKNPDDPKAAELFHRLSDALSVLTDSEARKAYDKLLHARKAAELRHRQLDAKRRKLKSELENRERAAQNSKDQAVAEEEEFRREVERLQREGRRELEEEQERLQKLIAEEKQKNGLGCPLTADWSVPGGSCGGSSAKLKVRWKGDDVDNRYDQNGLKKIFSKYGQVLEVAVLAAKKSGLIEMESLEAALSASNIEIGYFDNPLKVKLLPSGREAGPTEGAATFNDYESLVMRQMRQAEERKRLIADMVAEERQQHG